MWSYFPTLTALMPLGRQRASLENWVQGGHESGGTYGQMTEAMGCVQKATLSLLFADWQEATYALGLFLTSLVDLLTCLRPWLLPGAAATTITTATRRSARTSSARPISVGLMVLKFPPQ